MEIVNFSKKEKLAIICVLAAMMNVDGNVDIREVTLMEALLDEFHMSLAEAAQGRDLNLLVALATIRDFSQPKKLYVADLLVKMVEADRKVHPAEERFLEVIQAACQLIPN